MGTLAASGDTWGISGSTFILFYLVIAVVVWIWAVRTRRQIAGARGGGRPPADLTGTPYDAAYLNGGADLAVYAALSSMRVDGTIETAGRGNVVAVGALLPGADELERAIHATATSPVGRGRLRYHEYVAAALAAIERRLTAEGLLVTDDERRGVRQAGAWMLLVAGLGLARLVAGVANGKPVTFLVLATLGAAVVGVVLMARVPRRTPLGDATVSAMRAQHHRLSPANRPDWIANGATAAALGVGVFGMSALWASDPAFADELAAQKLASSGGGWSGGDSGSSYGGGAGCGGGSSCG
ncbi:TIGR04222 domain-containing membrane protein, partial [Pseudonocardia dioxanivorans]